MKYTVNDLLVGEAAFSDDPQVGMIAHRLGKTVQDVQMMTISEYSPHLFELEDQMLDFPEEEDGKVVLSTNREVVLREAQVMHLTRLRKNMSLGGDKSPTLLVAEVICQLFNIPLEEYKRLTLSEHEFLSRHTGVGGFLVEEVSRIYSRLSSSSQGRELIHTATS